MEIKKDIPLKEYSTFKIGGPAKFFCKVKNLDELEEAMEWAKKKNQKVFVLGGGSNVLFSDDGFDGLVIKIANDEMKKVKSEGEKELILCAAGVPLAKIVNYSLKKGLSGLEWAIGIPGTIGGAIRGNAGAFGGEMKNSVKSVRCIELDISKKSTGKLQEFEKEDCCFDYRNSVFKQSGNLLIWDCILNFEKKDVGKLQEEVQELISKRREKQPELMQYPSAGSVFKNPVASKKAREEFEKDKEIKCKDEKIPAGWLIERCGLKGHKIGDAMVSDKQANFIVNTGEATAEDVAILISLIKTKVRNQFGLQLEEEIQIVN